MPGETAADAHTSGTAARPQLTEDAFLDGRLIASQPATGYRAGIDAVLLAAAVPARPGETAFEAGCGAAVPSLCLAARVERLRVTGFEVQAGLCAVARDNIERNGLAARVRIVEGDIRAPSAALDAAGIARASSDHVFANPPYHEAGTVRTSPDAGRTRAHVLAPGDLEAWLRFAGSMARPGGSVTIIHRADALGRLLALMERRLGAVTVLPLHPRAGAPASRVIVQGVRGSRAPMRIAAGFVLHEADGRFTAAAAAVLRAAAPLPLPR